MKDRTLLSHGGRGDQSLEVRPVNAPLMRASTILFKNYDAWHKVKELRKTQRVLNYGAYGTTTNIELEKLVTELEGGYRAWLTPNGLTALSAVLVNYAIPGTHYIISDGVYKNVRAIVDEYLIKRGVEVDYCKADCSNMEDLIKPNTKLLFCESPASVLYEIIDLPKVSKIAHDHGMVVAIDSTFASGWIYKPLQHGADISMIAATKYLNGHSDVALGVVVVNEKTWPSMAVIPQVLGYTASPDDAYLVLRGMRTLPLRMKQHEENADKVVEYLQTRPEIKTIFYPKLKTHPGHDIYMRDFQGGNGLLTIELKDDYDFEEVKKFADSLKLFPCGASWGGYESLATIQIPPRTATDWSGRNFVRMHVGLEDPEDLIADIAQALDGISKEKKEEKKEETKDR